MTNQGINVNTININIDVISNIKDIDFLPKYQTESSVGMDLLAAIENEIVIYSMESVLIPTGIAIALPSGYEAQVRPRSGLAVKNKITVLNSPGTIDSDYRGEIKVCLINFDKTPFVISKGMRIAQLVIASYVKSNWTFNKLDETKRSDRGFGSTGV